MIFMRFFLPPLMDQKKKKDKSKEQKGMYYQKLGVNMVSILDNRREDRGIYHISKRAFRFLIQRTLPPVM